MSRMGKTLMNVAWMAILLGIVVEGAVLIVATSFGKTLATRPVLADLVQKVSWSMIVCVGLAIGRGASRLMSSSGKAEAVSGLAGLIAAPIAFAVARSLHEGVQEALFIKVFAGGAGSPVLLAMIKGLEYGCLGALLAWLAEKDWGKAGAHAAAGLAVGVVFGAAVLATMFADPTPPATGAVVSRGLNEIIHPVGCSLTLYAAEILGRVRGAVPVD